MSDKPTGDLFDRPYGAQKVHLHDLKSGKTDVIPSPVYRGTSLEQILRQIDPHDVETALNEAVRWAEQNDPDLLKLIQDTAKRRDLDVQDILAICRERRVGPLIVPTFDEDAAVVD